MRGQFYRDSLYAHSTIIIDHLVETFLSFPKKTLFLADSFYYTSHLNNSECVFPSYLL